MGHLVLLLDTGLNRSLPRGVSERDARLADIDRGWVGGWRRWGRGAVKEGVEAVEGEVVHEPGHLALVLRLCLRAVRVHPLNLSAYQATEKFDRDYM